MGLLLIAATRVCVLAGPAVRVDIGRGPVCGAPYCALVKNAGGGKSLLFKAVDKILPVPDWLRDRPALLKAMAISMESVRGDAGYRSGLPNNGTAFMAMFEVPAVELDVDIPGSPENVPGDAPAGDPPVRIEIVPRIEIFTAEGDQVLRQIQKGASGGNSAVSLESPFLLAFDGEPMNNYTAGEDFRRDIPGDCYTVGTCLGTQNEVAADLLARTSKGLAQRFWYLLLDGEDVPEEALEISQKMFTNREASLEEVQAALDAMPSRPEFPGELDGVVEHVLEMSARPAFSLAVEPGVMARLQLLSRTVSAANGLSEEDPYVAHRVLQLMFLMKGLVLLMKGDTITEEVWYLAKAIVNRCDADRKTLLDQGREKTESEVTAKMKEVIDRAAMTRKAAGEDASRLHRMLIEDVAEKLVKAVTKMYKANGGVPVAATALKSKISRPDASSYGAYTGTSGTYEEMRTPLLKEALTHARQRRMLEAEGSLSRPKYLPRG